MQLVKNYFLNTNTKKKLGSTLGSTIVRNREKKIKLTTIWGLVAKFLSMTVPLITIGLTFSYLGQEVYGLWLALISFFALFQFADLGLGNGLKTKLSQAYGLNDEEESKKLISSSFFMLLLISSVLMLIFWLVYPLIDWRNLINSESKIASIYAGPIVVAIVVSKIISIPISLVQRTQMALQEGYKTNFWISVSYFLSIVSIYLAVKFDIGKINLVWVSSLILVVISLLNFIIFFFFQSPKYRPSFKYFNTKTMSDMIQIGSVFFLLSILTVTGLSMDNFIVARTTSLEEAATYSIVSKIAFIISSLTTVISAPLWAANGEAFVKREYNWVKKNTKKTALRLFYISLIASIGYVLLGEIAINIWLQEDMDISIWLIMGLCSMQILLSFITAFFMVLNSLGIIRFQILLFFIFTPLSFSLKYYLTSTYGVNFLPWVGSSLYFFIILVPTVYKVRKVLSINE